MSKAIAFAVLLVVISSLSLSENQAWTHQGSSPAAHHSKDDNDPLNEIFELTFQHASREGVSQASNMFKVVWNGHTLKEWLPTDYEINTETWSLKAREGKNSIHFIATGISDGLGQLVDNIKLDRHTFCGYQNVIVNGGFEEGHNVGHGWSIWRDRAFKGWRCNDQIEVGWGRIYNSRWPASTHISELDTNHNSDIYQEFTLDGWFRLKH